MKNNIDAWLYAINFWVSLQGSFIREPKKKKAENANGRCKSFTVVDPLKIES